MITNLFNSFDPSSIFNLKLNWIRSLQIICFIPLIYWNSPNRIKFFFNLIFNLINKEIYSILNNNFFKRINLIILTLFLTIIFNNFLGLLPYIFTSSSHLVFNLTYALPLWLTLIIFGWIKKTQHIFTHLIPLRTPFILMPFIVLIESISNIIRPITLSVRLTANITAGHLLIILLRQNGPSSSIIIIILIIITELILFTLESAISVIQAYVFSILRTLYISEIN